MSHGWWVHKHEASLSLPSITCTPVPSGLRQPVHIASASYHMTVTTKFHVNRTARQLEGDIGKYVGVADL
jgi:hypothetical protein